MPTHSPSLEQLIAAFLAAYDDGTRRQLAEAVEALRSALPQGA